MRRLWSFKPQGNVLYSSFFLAKRYIYIFHAVRWHKIVLTGCEELLMGLFRSCGVEHAVDPPRLTFLSLSACAATSADASESVPHACRLSRRQSAPAPHGHGDESSWAAHCIAASYAVKHTTQPRSLYSR